MIKLKLKFIKECVDKNNGTKYHIGDELVFTVARGKEILKTGYAIEIKEEIKENKKTKGRKKATV